MQLVLLPKDIWSINELNCLCFQNIPPDLSTCVFVIEQALSVRALQELVTAAGTEEVSWYLLSNDVYLNKHNYFLENVNLKALVKNNSIFFF